MINKKVVKKLVAVTLVVTSFAGGILGFVQKSHI